MSPEFVRDIEIDAHLRSSLERIGDSTHWGGLVVQSVVVELEEHIGGDDQISGWIIFGTDRKAVRVEGLTLAGRV
jgi:hypothetical protein